MLGISTLCLLGEPLPEALAKLAGITGSVEVMDEGLHRLETAEPLLSHSCTFSIHAPCRGTNLASLLEPIRRASVTVMAECFAIAAEVNAPVVVHPGYFAWPEEREQSELQLKRSLADLSCAAREYSVQYTVENMGNWEYFLLKTPAELPLIEGCGFTLDVGHAHQNHCLGPFLARPAQHYHLHDNDTREDSHWAVGKGTIDFAAVMTAVRKSGGTPMIEVADFDGAVESLHRLGKML
ncbi:sugar phosphate isomerase/epimerase family protein [Methanoregula sp.]|uniref:sugar phosphate isomerase/epimerase family protein n=1 Tax=Methanoregula sp. TaxID=2052170 RepID=UPI003BAF60B6